MSDAQYHCATTDGGGVHSNSGVPNHGYALLVDGGTYNSQTVTAIGLVKAAHIYWRAQSVYQVPTTEVRRPCGCPRGIVHGPDRCIRSKA